MISDKRFISRIERELLTSQCFLNRTVFTCRNAMGKVHLMKNLWGCRMQWMWSRDNGPQGTTRDHKGPQDCLDCCTGQKGRKDCWARTSGCKTTWAHVSHKTTAILQRHPSDTEAGSTYIFLLALAWAESSNWYCQSAIFPEVGLFPRRFEAQASISHKLSG